MTARRSHRVISQTHERHVERSFSSRLDGRRAAGLSVPTSSQVEMS